MKTRILNIAACFAGLLIIGTSVSACKKLLGSKKDPEVQQILQNGAINPSIPTNVGYVPLLPFFTQSLNHPHDVYVGYDNMLYVADNDGLKIFDITGRLARTIPLTGATRVVQDRHIRTYVCGRVNKVVSGSVHNLASVYVIINTATSAQPQIIDTLIHPFCDITRKNTSFRASTDEQVKFTGICTFADNTLIVSRTGPVNNSIGVANPDNSLLIFDTSTTNVGIAPGVNSFTPSLKSCIATTCIASFATPPQFLIGSTSHDVLLVQDTANATFKPLWLKYIVDPNLGPEYNENTGLLNFDKSKADNFLYAPGRFVHPTSIFAATDARGYIFLTDAGTDSLHQFTRSGFEGVNPPASYNSSKQVFVSFGGHGSGLYQFNHVEGVCYNKYIVYVADRDNNRICRYKLSTDLEN